MSDLATFLSARFDEDEAVAQAASRDLSEVLSQVEYLDKATQADELHITRHGPARVFAEIHAKREIVSTWRKLHFLGRTGLGEGVAARAMQFLAVVYADHPDYDERWRP
ncbi:DUF6221 family protein [Streptomyces populi]|uniref:DUF6221 family protein n=1 Tax=Streptomyces populi TaxID=2058924 RepID=UPI0035D82562